MAMIEAELTLFQMQIEQMGANTAPFSQPGLGYAQKALDAVHVNAAPSGEPMVPVMNPMMLAIAHVHQSIVPSPPIRVNDAAAGHLPPQKACKVRFIASGTISVQTFHFVSRCRPLRRCCAGASPVHTLVRCAGGV